MTITFCLLSHRSPMSELTNIPAWLYRAYLYLRKNNGIGMPRTHISVAILRAAVCLGIECISRWTALEGESKSESNGHRDDTGFC